ncbi:hypothetical protein CEXT_102291 [Caerostris extrusa]|uniref:Uncharacterized protein n=1 Tax=Caerostris extrusa TaxID=172846 RepID=A0AAV4N6L3_CAEEX|nr:hypothetical protein CEXT_102291 [Caerostris extrusa]
MGSVSPTPLLFLFLPTPSFLTPSTVNSFALYLSMSFGYKLLYFGIGRGKTNEKLDKGEEFFEAGNVTCRLDIFRDQQITASCPLAEIQEHFLVQLGIFNSLTINILNSKMFVH